MNTMNELPSNSHKSKEQETKASERRFTSVVTSETRLEKSSAMSRIMSSFIKTDAKTIKNFIIDDFLVPNVKKGILEVINMIFYNTPNTQKSQGWSSPKVTYGGFVNGVNNSKPSSRRADIGFNYDKIVFKSRGDAELVLTKMCRAIEQYNSVSVLDLYDLAEVTTDMYTANKYGWTDLSTADVVRRADGYCLRLPDAKPI